jgi:uncharacterized membrane protein YphA (DoxX/SURF4 family)
MNNEPRSPNALGPLVLRLVLGVIFIYHGLGKVTGQGNDLGASWAGNLWNQQAKAPPDVLDKVDQMAGVDDTQKMDVKNRLSAVYSGSGTPVPESLQYAATQLAVAWGELLGGVLLILGCLTRLAAVAMIVVQVGAIMTVTWGKGFSFLAGGGYEYNLALLAMCLALALEGAGPLSVDACVKSRRKQPEQAAMATA